MADDDTIVLVCARFQGKLFLPDNMLGHCEVCQCRVQYRPHAPKPHLLRCMDCAIELAEPGTEVLITPEMLEDARRYFAKRRN